jgi:hypothetical protein
MRENGSTKYDSYDIAAMKPVPAAELPYEEKVEAAGNHLPKNIPVNGIVAPLTPEDISSDAPQRSRLETVLLMSALSV